MADSLLRLDSGRRLDDADPFAELTRIMGHDPRRESGQPPAEDDYEIDLERELIGGYDEPQGQGAYEPAPVAETGLPQPEAAADRDGHAAREPAFTDDDTRLEAEMAAIFEDELLEEELSGDAGQWADDDLPPAAQPAPYDEYAGPADEAPPQEYSEPAQYFEPDGDDGGLPPEPYQPLDPYAASYAAVADDLPYDAYDAPETGLGTADALPEPDAGHQTFSADSALADVDMDFGELVLDGPEAAAPEAVAAAEPAELSLEDELGLLLSQDDDAGHAGEAQSLEEPFHAYGLEAEAAGEENALDAGVEDELALDRGQFEPEHAEYQIPQSVEPAPDPFGALEDIAPAEAVEVPDLELVDVPETAIAVADDLDLPDLDFHEEQAPAASFDELEADFADILRPVEEAQPPFAAEAPDDRLSDEDRYFAEALGGAAGLTYAAARPAYASDPHDDAAVAADYDAVSARETVLSPPPASGHDGRRRMLLAAAAVIGVALVGGIGAYAFWSGDGGAGGTPVLVRADDDPLKIRPENPGGATVPNQDSQAHARATEGTGTAAAAQERLVRTAEEPVDVAARAQSGLPGVTIGENLPNLEGSLEDGAARIEDRLEAEQAIAAVADDVISVTPRRVRTLVVRPDGTMVPREQAAPRIPEMQASAEPPSGSLLGPVNTGQPEAAREQTATASQNAAPPAGPATGTTPTQAQAPAAQPAAPVAQQPAAPAAQPAPAQQQVAAVPPARTAPAAPPVQSAPSGEWSMQIASQPSPESAQATYQDLARRHSGLLSGRGVNIVRADIPGRGIYYRVRIPASSRAEAVTLCERYQAAGGSCFVSR